MRVRFRIGNVFPHDDAVSQFMTGLCIVVNDVTLMLRHMDRIEDSPEGQSGVFTYYLYLTCAFLREAAHFLEKGLKDADVASFLDDLSDDGRVHLETVKDSFAPWQTSFVKQVLKPVRDVVFHYTPMSLDGIRPHLEGASDEISGIEMGEGTYLETRYEFADAVVAKYVLSVWGDSVPEAKDILERVGQLVLALTFFAHEAMKVWLERVDRDDIEVVQ